MANLIPGSLVQLRSGSPTFVVVRVASDPDAEFGVAVLWWDARTGAVKRMTVPAYALRAVRSVPNRTTGGPRTFGVGVVGLDSPKRAPVAV